MTPGPRSNIATGVLGEAAIRELDNGLTGSVVGPGDPSYETARRVWNHTIDQRPGAVVRVASTQDVARTIRFARSEGRPIAIRGGAHSVAGLSTCDDGVVLDLARLSAVLFDVESRRAFGGGGTTWKDFDAATQQHGLGTTGGLVSSTGLGGFTLGGGFGHLVRKYGLACDNLLSVELVTADGSVVDASASHNPKVRRIWCAGCISTSPAKAETAIVVPAIHPRLTPACKPSRVSTTPPTCSDST